MDERHRIALLARLLGAPAPGVSVGIGDDAAVLESSGTLVWTIDEQVEGAHFRRELLSWHEVGWRSYMAAASDVAAMGATPWCALCALVLPDDVDDAALEQIATGQRDAAGVVGAPIVGGNLSRGPAVSLATTLLGRCEDRPVQRAGARPGDGVWMAGAVGLAAAGLRALESHASDPRLAPAIAAWRTPRALVGEGRAMARAAHAAIDVSDGLARDAGHVADAGAVQIVLFASELQSDPQLVAASAALGADALDLALHGGEDYALVAASAEPLEGFRRIGEVRPGSGLKLRTAEGEAPLEPRGFDHFTSRNRRPAASRP